MENVNMFDIVVIALVVVLGLKGLMKGFIKELFGLIGIVGGVFVASRMAKDVGDVVAGIFALENQNTILLVGFIVGLILFWILAYVLGSIIEKVFEVSGLGVLDRLLGFLFGAGKIFLLFSIIAYATTGVKLIKEKMAPKMKDSIMFPVLVETGGYIIKLDTTKLSENVKKEYNEVVKKAQKTAEDNVKEISKEVLKQQTQTEKTAQETINSK